VLNRLENKANGALLPLPETRALET